MNKVNFCNICKNVNLPCPLFKIFGGPIFFKDDVNNNIRSNYCYGYNSDVFLYAPKFELCILGKHDKIKQMKSEDLIELKK